MKSSTRRKLEMVKRVRDFNRASPLDDPSHAGVATRLEERLSRAEALATQEQTGRLDAAAATRNRREVRRGLQSELMRYVSRVAEVAAREHPELAGRFVMPSHQANNAFFLARAWDMLNLAKANQELLVKHGLGGTQLDQLASELTRFEEVTEQANAGRRNHVGARAELASVTTELMELVGLLDVLNQSRYRGNADLLASWNSARNVAGPFKPTKPETPPVSAPSDGVAGKAA